MPFLSDEKLVEGQGIRYTLGLKDKRGNLLSLVGATGPRIYYRIMDRVTKAILQDAYWSESDGVVIVNNRLRFIQVGAIEGFYSVFPHILLPTGAYVNRSADPAQFYVRKIHEL